MELWIRNQAKDRLKKVKDISLSISAGNIFCDNEKFGEYKTRTRALEILDEISSKIKNSYLIKNKMLLSPKDIEEQLNTFEEALNGSPIIQTPAYDIEPINTNIVYYEMPKE